jgi:hypothetical protein
MPKGAVPAAGKRAGTGLFRAAGYSRGAIYVATASNPAVS